MLEDYYIVHKSILPEFFDRIVTARHLAESGMSISNAVKQAGISRSTYYKYNDYIVETTSLDTGRKVVMSMILTHETGILSQVLGLISRAGASVLTIDQTIPVHGKAGVTISLDIGCMPISINSLITQLASQPGVENPKLIAAE